MSAPLCSSPLCSALHMYMSIEGGECRREPESSRGHPHVRLVKGCENAGNAVLIERTKSTLRLATRYETRRDETRRNATHSAITRALLTKQFSDIQKLKVARWDESRSKNHSHCYSNNDSMYVHPCKLESLVTCSMLGTLEKTRQDNKWRSQHGTKILFCSFCAQILWFCLWPLE